MAMKKVHIFVMGMCGAGKSTFIKAATRDPSIVIGYDLDAGTIGIADYILIYDNHEIHLIDTPGFNDPVRTEAETLEGIAQMLNTIYRRNESIAGVLYLHDITRGRLASTDKATIRLLEEMLGALNYSSCTIVTTKWNKDTGSQALNINESLESVLEARYWNRLRTTGRGARIARFDGSHQSAMNIIVPTLDKSFVPIITQEMVSATGSPLLSLKDTGAGAYFMEFWEKRLQATGQSMRIEELRQVLSSSWKEDVFQENLKEYRRLDQIKAVMNARPVRTLRLIGESSVSPVLPPATFGMKGLPRLTTADSQLNAGKKAFLEKYALPDSPIVDLPDFQISPQSSNRKNPFRTRHLAQNLFEGIFRLLVILQEATKEINAIPASARQECGREMERLLLWGDGVGIGKERLDDTLDKSAELKMSVLSLLSEVGAIVIGNLAKYVKTSVPDFHDKVADLRVLLEKAETVMEENGLRRKASFAASDSDISEQDFGEGVREIASFTDCLMDLTPALERPAVEPEVDSLTIPRDT